MSNILAYRRFPHVNILTSTDNKRSSRGPRTLFFTWNYTDNFCMLTIHISLNLLKGIKISLWVLSRQLKISDDGRCVDKKFWVKTNPEKYQRKKNLGNQGEVKKWWEGGTLLFLSRKWQEWNDGPGKDTWVDLLIRSRAAQKYSDMLTSLVIWSQSNHL